MGLSPHSTWTPCRKSVVELEVKMTVAVPAHLGVQEMTRFRAKVQDRNDKELIDPSVRFRITNGSGDVERVVKNQNVLGAIRDNRLAYCGEARFVDTERHRICQAPHPIQTVPLDWLRGGLGHRQSR